MGLSIGWIGIENGQRDAVLAAAGLVDTGEPDPELQSLFSLAELPNGWLVLQTNLMDYVTTSLLSSLSKDGRAIGCLIEEHVMFSGVRCFENGEESWWVLHEAEKGIYDLSMRSPPPTFREIRDRIFDEQDREGGSAAGVDFIFGIPLQLAAAVCSYRHDGMLEGPEPQFTALRSARRPKSQGGVVKKLRSLWGR